MSKNFIGKSPSGRFATISPFLDKLGRGENTLPLRQF